MKTFKISKKNNPVAASAPFDYIMLTLSGGDVCLITDIASTEGLSEGESLRLVKKAAGNEGVMAKVCDTRAVIKKIEVSDGKRYIYFDYMYIEPLTVESFYNISGTDYKYKCYFTTDTLMVPGDFAFYKQKMGKDYYLYINPTPDSVVRFEGLALCYPGELDEGKDIVNTGGYCCDPSVQYFNYDTMERNSVLAKTYTVLSGNYVKPEAGNRALFSSNPYYFTSDSGEIFLFPGVSIERFTEYLNLGVVLDQDYDAKRAFQEYQVNELFVKKIKSSIIPDFVDLEKVKYAPAFISGPDETGNTILELATGLTFNMHFRTRVSGTTNKDIPPEEAKYYFEDTWHVDDATDTWNFNGVNSSPKPQAELYSDENFVNSSNLIGYLGFTDEDIYNQKNKVKKTFIRLLFYDGINPLTQNLLYYSTIFLDSGELFGRFVKRKARLMDEDSDFDEAKTPVVWSPTAATDVESAVTSQLTVNDEYDMTKSGEGFNLYLFRQDAPVENTTQDIYMKIEFNHAGIGRTVPLIVWPKNDLGVPENLTIENYLKNLYIKVRISLTDKGYVYAFPDAVAADEEVPDSRCNGIVWENERIVLNLFEPRIKPEDLTES